MLHFILIFKGNEYDIILGCTIHSYENKHTSLTNIFFKMQQQNIYLLKQKTMWILEKIYLQINERLFDLRYFYYFFF